MSEKEISQVFVTKPLSLDGSRRITALKESASQLLELIEATPISPEGARMVALARTRLEECIMWAVKAQSREIPKPKPDEDFNAD